MRLAEIEYLGNKLTSFGVRIDGSHDESKTEGGVYVLVNLVTHLLPKMQVGNEHLEVGRTPGVQGQEVGDISRKEENVRRDVLSPELKGSHGMTKLLEMIPTSSEPRVLASVMPEGSRRVSTYLPWWRNGGASKGRASEWSKKWHW